MAIAATFYLIGCFAIAAWAKLRDLESFVATVRQILPAAMSRVARLGSATVIAVEIAIAGLLVVSLTTRVFTFAGIAAILAMGIGAVFASAIASVLVWGGDVPCHCFGEDDAAINPMSFSGPAFVAIAGLVVATSGALVGTPAVWIAGAVAGGYLLIFQRFLSQVFGRPGNLRQT